MANNFEPYKKASFRTEKGKTISVEKYKSLPFTNDALKVMAQKGAFEGTVIIADRQTEPRGTLGKKFFPEDTAALHMSILLRPSFSVNQSLMLTSMAAVAVARAIKSNSDAEIGIKWVNDIYFKKKKISGVLAEGVVNNENGFDYVIIGISLSLLPAVFPPKLADIIAEVFSEDKEGTSDKLAHSILSEFFSMYENFNMDNSFIEEYRALSILDGKRVHVLVNGERQAATALEITENAHLSVRLKDGSEYVLNSTAELLD